MFGEGRTEDEGIEEEKEDDAEKRCAQFKPHFYTRCMVGPH